MGFQNLAAGARNKSSFEAKLTSAYASLSAADKLVAAALLLDAGIDINGSLINVPLDKLLNGLKLVIGLGGQATDAGLDEASTIEVDIASGGYVAKDDGDTVALGNVAQSATKVATIKVTNTGTRPILLGSPVRVGAAESRLVLGTFSAVQLAPGANATATITFDPDNGAQAGIGALAAGGVKFYHTDGNRVSPINLTVTGAGIAD